MPSKLKQNVRNKFLYIVTVIVLILISSWNVFHYFSDSPSSSHSKEANTIVKVAAPIINMGRVKRGGKAEVSFTLYNAGSHPLFIKNVKVECHCTSTDWDKKPINTNDSTIINVKYDAANTGFFQKSIRVETNSENSPILLIFRGEII